MTFRPNRLALITLVYWVLLVYVVAALVWWFIALSRQNDSMALLLINELRHDEPGYVEKAEKILDSKGGFWIWAKTTFINKF